MENIKELILQRANQLKQEIINHRRQFHQNPELHTDLPKTVAYVKEKLVQMGYEPIDCGTCGVVATVGGKNSGKTFLIRGDMDALPLKEETDLEFKSNNNNMHACGHDMHTAMMLGAAKILREIEDEIQGTVKLMFQPGEETLAGAKLMIENGLLESPKVDAAMMIHVFTGLPFKTGSVVFLTEGVASAAADRFEIHIQGKGGHGSMPETTIDPINVACHIHTAIQTINSRELGLKDEAVFTVGKIQAGTTSNIIPDTATMEGTIRTFSKDMRDFVPKRMKEITEYISKAFRAEAEFKYIQGCPSVINDNKLLENIKESAKELVGQDMVAHLEDIMPGGRLPGSEDFGFVSEKIPSVILILGAGSPSEGYEYQVHHPKATFNEDALVNGTAMYVYSAINWLDKNK